jgi:uncharacterized protein
MSQSAGPRTKSILYITYWVISVSAIAFFLIMPYLHFEQQSKVLRNTIFAVIVGLFFAKFVASLFFLFDDLRRGVLWVVSKLSSAPAAVAAVNDSSDRISRSAFLSWAGMVVGGGLFGSLVYGFRNKYNYQVKRFQLAYDNLPASFKGLKIVHISDIHSGSFTNKQAVLHGVKMILDEKPDLILFTGDLVNDEAPEMTEYIDVFYQLKAPLGVYSTLGNHDYGDYVQWESREAKAANLERLKQIHGELGWRLLMNEHVEIQKGDEKIALLGVENWSAKARFPKHGDLAKAHSGSKDYAFKILMSHDPSHWDAQVRPSYPDIDLMLAGHTHGMQFGIEIPGFRWSPVQYMYKQWAGLYEEGRQKLYVNRGYGFIGYPGRVGILPEITVLELV